MGNSCCDAALPEVPQQAALREVKQQEALTEVKQQEARLEVKQQEARPEVKQQKALPEVKQQKALPEVKQQKALPEVKQQEALPKVKQQEARPEVKQQEARPEVKQQEARPEVKQEEAQRMGGFQRLESKFHFSPQIDSEKSPHIDVVEESPRADPLTDTDGSKFRHVKTQTIPLQTVPNEDPRLLAGVKTNVILHNVKNSHYVSLILSYNFRNLLLERGNMSRLIPLKYILCMSSTEEELKEKVNEKLIRDVGDVNVRVALSIIGLSLPICFDFESIDIKQSFLQAVEMLSVLDYGKACAKVSYMERGKVITLADECRTPTQNIKESNEEDGEDSLEEVFGYGRIESKVVTFFKPPEVMSDNVPKVDSSVQTLVIIPSIQPHPDLLLGVPVMVILLERKEMSLNALIRVDYEFKTLLISKNSSIRVLPCKFIIRIIEGQRKLNVEVLNKRIKAVGDVQKRLAISIVGLSNFVCIDFMNEHMKSQFSADVQRLCDIAVVDQAAMVMDERGVHGLIDLAAEKENQ